MDQNDCAVVATGTRMPGILEVLLLLSSFWNFPLGRFIGTEESRTASVLSDEDKIPTTDIEPSGSLSSAELVDERAFAVFSLGLQALLPGFVSDVAELSR
jgi:hypothetical protein